LSAVPASGATLGIDDALRPLNCASFDAGLADIETFAALTTAPPSPISCWAGG